MGKSKIIGLVVIGGVVTILLLGILGRVTLSKKNTTASKNTAQIVQSTAQSSSSVEHKNPNSSIKEISSNSETKTSTSSTNIETQTLEKIDVEVEVDSPSITKASPPKVTANKESRALITEREVFKSDNVYLFSLKLALPREGQETIEIRYFTTAANFDKVKSGNLLNIIYGEDDKGNIVIASVDTVN